MAVDVSVDVFPHAQMTSREFALMIEKSTTVASGIIYGAVASKGGATEIEITEGYALVRGRIVHIESGTISMSLDGVTGDETRHLVLSVNLENVDQPGDISVMLDVPTDTADFNMVDGIAYLEIAELAITTLGIDTITPMSPIVPAYEVSRNIFTETTDPTAADGKDGDLWFVYES